MSKVNKEFQALADEFSERFAKLAKDKVEYEAFRAYARKMLIPELVKLVKEAIDAKKV